VEHLKVYCLFTCRGLAENLSIYLQGVGRKFVYLPAGGGQKFVYLPAGGWPKVSSIYLQGVGRKLVYLPAGSWPQVHLFT
jgi:hypothetical protein